jgi:Mg2+ and Co2+ transporter CorA
MITQQSSKLTQALAPLDNQIDQSSHPLPLKPSNYGIFSRKGGGKTTLLLNLLSKKESPWHKHFNKIYLISPTAMRDEKMEELIEDIGDQYYEELNNDVLQEILDKIDDFNDKWKEKKKKGKPNHCIIYDDCIHSMKGKQSRLMDLLATQNRHHNITNVYLMQKYNTYLPTLVRSNLDVISFFRTDNKKELDSFIEEMNYDEDKLMKLYEFATATPYSFLHINCYHNPPKFYKCFDEIKIKS